MRRFLLLPILMFCCMAGRAQRLPAMVFSGTGASIQYENDLFGHTDYYYTQGLQLSYNNPSLQRFFLAKAMLRLNDTAYSAGIGVEQDCYSPMSILSDSILKGDRPFAAGLMAHYYLSSVKGKSTLTSRLSLGVVGAAAGGYEMQRGIHENTGNIIPHGWQYQIRNDAIVNYEAAYAYRLIQLTGGDHYLVPKLTISGLATANAGTYLDKLSLGAQIMAGFTSQHSHPDFWIFYEARAAAIGYDATLQGGIFNRSSPYTISSDQIERTTFQQKGGLSIRYGFVQFQGSYTMLSREFEVGQTHAWGGLSASLIF